MMQKCVRPSFKAAAAAVNRQLPSSSATQSSRRHLISASYSTSASSHGGTAKNQIFNPVRNTDTLQTYISLSSSSRTPLLTLWTASWCPSCRSISPLLRSLVASGVGEAEGGVALVDVEFDAPDIMSASPNPAMTYMITSVPTLLSFDAGEPQGATRVADVKKMADRAWLAEWIRTEARRHGGRGGGGGGGGSGGMGFGGLFGTLK